MVDLGRDDFFCIYPDGELHAWQNTPGSDERFPNWVSLGVVKPAEDGYPQAQVRLGDIDGDGCTFRSNTCAHMLMRGYRSGRVDYIVLDPNGDATAFRNGGQEAIPAYWQSLGLIFTGKNKGDLSGVRFL